MEVRLNTDQRPGIWVYCDFLESDVLNYYQKIVFIYLKKFADQKGQCYPSIRTLSRQSGISVKKVKETLKQLEEKGVISKANRTRPDGGKSSNLYTVYDYGGMWRKEKAPACEPTKAHTQAPCLKNTFNSTGNSAKSQASERYSLEQIRELFDYDVMVYDCPVLRQDIDAVMNILHDTLNITSPTIRISGQDKPAMAVIGKLMKLDKESIIYAIGKFQEQRRRIASPRAYMLTILYYAPEQMELDMINLGRSNGAF